jgi:hypothetical protein
MRKLIGTLGATVAVAALVAATSSAGTAVVAGISALLVD